MSTMLPCPGCTRHVRQAETACPFCGADLAEAISAWKEPTPPAGYHRAWAVALFAAAAGLPACSSSDEYGAPAPYLPEAGAGGNPGTGGTSAAPTKAK